MTPVIEVISDSGAVQFNTENKIVRCLRATGTATVLYRHDATYNYNVNVAKTVDITYTTTSENPPHLYISGTNTAGSQFGILHAKKVGNTWTWRVMGYEHAPSFKYYIFDAPPSETNSEIEIQVKDATGSRVVYSSAYWPLRLKLYDSNDSLPAGRQYAIKCGAGISYDSYDEHYTNQEVWTYWRHYAHMTHMGPHPTNPNLVEFVGDTRTIAGGVNRNHSPPDPNMTDPLAGWGSSGPLMVADVTDFDGSLIVSPSTFTVTADATTRAVTGTGSGYTTTPFVTLTVTGGTAPFSYQWEKIGGDSLVVASGSTTTNQLRTTTSSATTAGQSFSAVYQCIVTDATSRVVYSPAITFTHTQPAVSLTPAPMSWPNQIFSSPENSVYGAYSAIGPNVTGISQPIRLKFEVINMVDNLTAGSWSIVDIQGSTHTNLASGISYNIGSNRTLTVSNGQNLTIKLEGHTTAKDGHRLCSGQIRVTNLDDNNAVVGTFNIGLTVDNDNSSDQTPNPISWTNHNVVTNDYWAEAKQAANTRLTGVSQPVTLTWTISNLSKSGGTAYLDIYKNWSFQGRINVSYSGQSVSMTVANNDLIEVVHSLETGAGRHSVSYNVNVTNSSTGSSFGSYSTSLVVDNDNNYNVSDVTPDYIGFYSHSVNTSDYWGQSVHSPIYVTGINAPIQLEWWISGLATTGGTAYLDVYKNWTFIQRIHITSNNQFAWMVVNNGDLVEVVHYFNNQPQGGRVHTNYYVGVYNKTDGYGLLGQYYVSGSVG